MSDEEESLRCVRVGDPWRVREIAEALEAAGIGCRIDAYPPGAGVQPQRGGRGAGAATQMGVYVAPADFERSLAIAAEHERGRMPERRGRGAALGRRPGQRARAAARRCRPRPRAAPSAASSFRPPSPARAAAASWIRPPRRAQSAAPRFKKRTVLFFKKLWGA